MDPAYREEHGDVAAHIVVKVYTGILEALDEAGGSLKIADIALNNAKEAATLTLRIHTNWGSEKADDPQQWVKRNGDWYLFIEH